MQGGLAPWADSPIGDSSHSTLGQTRREPPDGRLPAFSPPFRAFLSPIGRVFHRALAFGAHLQAGVGDERAEAHAHPDQVQQDGHATRRPPRRRRAARRRRGRPPAGP